MIVSILLIVYGIEKYTISSDDIKNVLNFLGIGGMVDKFESSYTPSFSPDNKSVYPVDTFILAITVNSSFNEPIKKVTEAIHKYIINLERVDIIIARKRYITGRQALIYNESCFHSIKRRIAGLPPPLLCNYQCQDSVDDLENEIISLYSEKHKKRSTKLNSTVSSEPNVSYNSSISGFSLLTPQNRSVKTPNKTMTPVPNNKVLPCNE